MINKKVLAFCRLLEQHLSTTTKGLFSSGLVLLLANPAVAGVNAGDILVTDWGTNSILQVNPDTGNQTVLSSGGFLSAPGGMAIDTNGDILIANWNALDGSGAIVRIDPFSGNQSIISSGGFFTNPAELTLDGSGNLFVADWGGGIIQVDSSDGTQTSVASGGYLSRSTGLAFDAGGKLLTTTIGGPSNILSIDPVTGVQTPVTHPDSIYGAGGLEVESSGHILVSDVRILGGSNSIYRIDPNTDEQTTVSSGDNLIDLYNIALDETGNIFAANGGAYSTPSVVKVDPVSGEQTVLSSDGNLINPVGIFAVSNSYSMTAPLDSDWTGSASSAWENPDNWSGSGEAADSGDAVVIESSATTTVTGPATPTEVRSLSLSNTAGGTTELNLNGGGALTVTHGLDIDTGGVLSGTDSLIGDVNNSGLLSPGNSPGLFEIDGNYNQTSDGTLFIELGGLLAGTEYDVLNVTGTAVLGGALEVTLFEGFNPSDGDSFDFLVAGTIAGIFAPTSLPMLADGLGWLLNYSDNPSGMDIATLSVTGSAVPLPASFWLLASGVSGLLGYCRRK